MHMQSSAKIVAMKKHIFGKLFLWMEGEAYDCIGKIKLCY